MRTSQISSAKVGGMISLTTSSCRSFGFSANRKMLADDIRSPKDGVNKPARHENSPCPGSAVGRIFSRGFHFHCAAAFHHRLSHVPVGWPSVASRCRAFHCPKRCSNPIQKTFSATRVAFAMSVNVRFLAGRSGNVDPSTKYRFSTSWLRQSLEQVSGAG